MKVGAYIAFFFGIANLIIGIAGLSSQYADQAGGKIGFGIGATALGFYLLKLTKQKEEEQKKKDNWNSGNN